MLIFADGFEHYGTSPNEGRDNMLAGLWAGFILQGDIGISSAQARTGTKSLCFTPGFAGAAGEARFALGGAPRITVGAGFGLYLAGLPSANSYVGFQLRDNTNTAILTLCFQSDGSIAVRKGGVGGAIVDISDAVLTAGTFNHIECKTTFDAVAGSIEIRVNGITKLLDGSLNLGAVGCAQMALMAFNAAAAPLMYFDDLFVWDTSGTYNNNFLGPQRILTIFPNADTAQADFTKVGAATGYGCIGEVPPDGDTTYLYSTVVGNKSDFALPTLPPELVTIAGIFVPAMARLDSAGIGNLKMSMKSSTAVLAGSDNPLTPGYTYYKNIFEYDPNTSAAWTKAGLQAALLRVEKSL